MPAKITDPGELEIVKRVHRFTPVPTKMDPDIYQEMLERQATRKVNNKNQAR